jgi:predicted transcriptional regulator
MKRTKLEDYVSIIQTLKKRGPIDKRQISNIEKMDSQELTEYLEFLLANNIVEKQDSGKKQVYVVTLIGTKIIKYFCETNNEIKAWQK